MTTIQIPKEYGYVLATTAASIGVAFWHGVRVTGFRKAAKVPYPNAYASQESITAAGAEEKHAKYLFNCAQRAHANFLENYAIALTGLLVAGLRYPVASAVTGAIWNLSRIVYAVGYTSPKSQNGQGRYFYGLGVAFWFSQFTWIGMLGYWGYELLQN